MDMEQRRAARGGERGANGEWYEGGRFIATQEDTIKQAPACRGMSPADGARQAAEAERSACIATWLARRQTAVAGIVANLTANPGNVDQATWRRRVEDYAAGFMPSLGRQLHVTGTLSSRQAECVARELLGRLTKKNTEEWESMIVLLTEQL